MSEQMIEWAVEKMIDRLDERYLEGEFNDAEYHEQILKIDAWAKNQYLLNKNS